MRNIVRFGCVVLAGASAACGDGSLNALRSGYTPAPSAQPPTDTTTGADAGSVSTGVSGGNPGTGNNGAPGDAGRDPGAADASSPPGSPPLAGAGIPCDVAAVLAAKCDGCHASPPVNGSLSALVTIADLLAPAKEDPTKSEAQLSLSRMQNGASPMPPASVGNPVTAAETQAFQSWIQNNYRGSCADAGAPPPASDVFSGAPPFTSKVESSTHNVGQDCMSGCHNHGFTFAGTLTDGSGKGVAGAEVRLVDSAGAAITVHTGPDGNFHSSTPFAGPAHVGARDANTTANMITSLQTANGGCSGCHATGGTVAPIHVP